MKTKFYWFTLLASAALIAQAQAQAGGHHGGGGGGASAGFAPAAGGGSRGSGAGGFHGAPFRSYSGGRMTYPGQRFSSFGPYSPSSPMYRPRSFSTFGGAPVTGRQFTPGNSNRGNRVARFNGTNGVNRTGQVRGSNNLRADWRHHVFAQHSANWNRNWDRHHDHWWHGHRCHFLNGSWVIFDTGFYPWWGWYGYPYDYYSPYGYYGPGYSAYYDPNASDDNEYYDQKDRDQKEYDQKDSSSDTNVGSTVATVQEELTQHGFYHGAIDGILGPETQRAVARYQRSHGLRVTGTLTPSTLQNLGLPRVATE